MKKEKKILILLIVFLIISVFLGISLGYSSMNMYEILMTLTGNGNFKENFIIFSIRLPRVIILLITGFSLAIAGGLLQIITKNDLADTGIIGINSGAGLFITILYLLIPTNSEKYIYFVPILAFLGGTFSGLLIFFFSREKTGKVNIQKLILVGIGFSMAFSGLMVLLVSSAERSKLEFIAKWLNGNIWGNNWYFVIATLPWLLILLSIIFYKIRIIDTFLLNEETALSIGVNVNKEKIILLFISIALASISVAIAGAISFLGLISPHISRMLVGSRAKICFPTSMLIGATLIIIADIIGRNILLPNGIPTGIVVALIGVPYFIYLINRKK